MWDWCANNIFRGGMFGHMGGGFMMLFPILIIILIFYFFNKNDKNKNTDNVTPLDILKKRYARGEISKEEFENMKKDLF
jgi:putative membrane protein